MAHEVKYRYRAYMPIDGTRKIVHVEALTQGVMYRFVSIEQAECRFGTSICFPVRDREDIIILTTRKTDEEKIKRLLAEFNHGDHYYERLDEIEIVVGEPVRGRRGGTSDSTEHGDSNRAPNPKSSVPWHRRQTSEQYLRRPSRYSHGPDPNIPPRGWDPR